MGNIFSWLFDNISSTFIAVLLIACLALVSLCKCTRNERDIALQNAAIAIETNKTNKETIDALEAEIVKRDELVATWQEELAKERKARDDAYAELNALLEQNENIHDWSSEWVPDDVWSLFK